MFAYKPDFEEVMGRYEAWWDCRILDRPLVSMTFPKPAFERMPAPPPKQHVDFRDRWMDTAYGVESTVARLHNTVHYADALPIAWPNLGPEVFSAFYGCPMVYTETTSWAEPVLADWKTASVEELQLDQESFYFRKILEVTDALLDAGRGRFLVGYTDLHGGGDAIAAFRDPQQLCIDLIEHPEEVRSLCDRVTVEFLQVYDLYHDKLAAAGMPSTTWLGATGRGRFHVASNDFSCMISERMFEELFLPGLVQECRHMDRCIYHLDGPEALRHLDALLDIPEIQAIQWVPGSGRSYWKDWVEVYARIQAAGRAFVVYLSVRELEALFDALRPEGAWLVVSGVGDQEEAEAALQAISRWR